MLRAYAVHIVWLTTAVVGFLAPGARGRRVRITLLILLLAILAVLAGTHSGGDDFARYLRFLQRYRRFEDVDISAYPEFGFQALMAAANLLGMPYGMVYTLIAAFSFGGITLAVRRLGENEALYYFLYIPKYFFQGHINQIRSTLVYPFVLLSADWLSRGRDLPVVLAGLLLATLHLSALLLCFLPLLRPVRLTRSMLALVFIAPILFSVVSGPILTLLWEATGLRQLGYVMAAYETVPLISLEVFRRAILYAMVVLLVLRGRTDPAAEWVAKLFLLAWVLYVGLLDARVIQDRLGAMFGVVEPLVLLMFARLVARDERPLWILLVLALGGLEFALRAVVYQDVPIYTFFWDLGIP